MPSKHLRKMTKKGPGLAMTSVNQSFNQSLGKKPTPQAGPCILP